MYGKPAARPTNDNKVLSIKPTSDIVGSSRQTLFLPSSH